MELEADFRHGLGNGELPIWVLVIAGPGVFPHVQDQLDHLSGHAPVGPLGSVHAEDLKIAGEASGTHTPVEAAPGQVVQLGHPVGDHKGVVIGHAGNAGAEDYVLSARQGGGDELVGGGNVLPHGGEMLADPGLAVAQAVQGLHLDQVRFQGGGQVGAGWVEGHSKVTQSHNRLLWWQGSLA